MPALPMPVEQLEERQRRLIQILAGSLVQLGNTLRERGRPDCVPLYEEAAQLDQHIGDQPAEAMAAMNLGHAYKDIRALRDLERAETWYRRSLELRDQRDALGRSQSIDQVGLVMLERFMEGKALGISQE